MDALLQQRMKPKRRGHLAVKQSNVHSIKFCSSLLLLSSHMVSAPVLNTGTHQKMQCRVLHQLMQQHDMSVCHLPGKYHTKSLMSKPVSTLTDVIAAAAPFSMVPGVQGRTTLQRQHASTPQQLLSHHQSTARLQKLIALHASVRLPSRTESGQMAHMMRKTVKI